MDIHGDGIGTVFPSPTKDFQLIGIFGGRPKSSLAEDCDDIEVDGIGTVFPFPTITPLVTGGEVGGIGK